MKNFEKFKTAEERLTAFYKYCDGRACMKCPMKELIKNNDIEFCLVSWLGIEAEEEKREKKYEYAEMYSNGDVGHEKGDSINDVNCFLSDGSIIVRREVGEWEEVK